MGPQGPKGVWLFLPQDHPHLCGEDSEVHTAVAVNGIQVQISLGTLWPHM